MTRSARAPARRLPSSAVQHAFDLARERYAGLGVNVDSALRRLGRFPISVHCWQGDDIRGFETSRAELGGGLAVTGNHPGRARTPSELRADLEKALSLTPGKHRVNLHAIYGEFDGRRVERTEIKPSHFSAWINWARHQGLGLDFNPTCFAHARAADGFTLSHPDRHIRSFWIEHCAASRRVGAAMARALGNHCLTNLWIPDGFKDTPAERAGARSRLLDSLDQVFQEKLPHVLDSVEPKLFGLGAESCTVGSHDFYLAYATSRQKFLCLDAGHFHPTESVADKISSVLPFLPGILLHLSRGVRWDSDHVVTWTDELQAMAREVTAVPDPERVHLGLDYFDASINRVAAWVIGLRAVQRALLTALLEPPQIRAAEKAGDLTARLAWQEEAKALPATAVWDHYCAKHNVPVGEKWLAEIQRHERDVLSLRG